jgi:hypothetical protein
MDPTKPPSRPGRSGAVDRLEVGQRILDLRNQIQGVVLEYACQYAHPKADPVYSYLIRWDDGRVNALSEAALDGEHGYEPVD